LGTFSDEAARFYLRWNPAIGWIFGTFLLLLLLFFSFFLSKSSFYDLFCSAPLKIAAVGLVTNVFTAMTALTFGAWLRYSYSESPVKYVAISDSE